MAIVKMKKINIVCLKEDKEKLLKLLQKLGVIQVVDLKEKIQEYPFESERVSNEVEYEFSKVKFTYEFLKQYADDKKGLFTPKKVLSFDEFEKLETYIDWNAYYKTAKHIEESMNLNRSKRSKLFSLIDQYSNWINFDASEEELKTLKNVSYFIGSVNKKYKEQLILELNENFKEVYIETISEKQNDLNMFVLSYKDIADDVFEVLKRYGFTKLNLELDKAPKDKILEFNKEIEELDLEYEGLINKAKDLASKIDDIEKVYDYLYSKLQLEKAKENIVLTKRAAFLSGWIPEDKVGFVKENLSSSFKDIYIEIEDAEDEEAPVLLKNNWLSEPFEVVTSMYALPKHSEIDPTPVLTPFFLLFFGMMMADVGYGILMFIVGLLGLKLTNAEGDMRKLLKLILYCSIPTIIFGFLYGSFFGGIIKLKPLWVDPVNEPMEILKWSIIFGMVHLYVGLGVKAYMLIRDGKVLDAFFDVGAWYLLLSGLIWMFLGGGFIAKAMAILGALIILLTHGRENKTLVGKFFGGFYSLYGVTGYLGDALSYSRLLALGLASGLIGWSFNLLISLLGKGVVVYIFGPIIFIAGHTFNFLIGILGTYVHTSRLQYLEFFGKFYEGGGKAFEPLKIKTKFIKVE
ncbi:V/A-type H+-transporting ATPase subunit I [Caloramator fervidus]|uniref:NtpI n=1 Tax=Caloramator fervidus TaxID=29344 RepID=Q2EQS1_9CLOT|nr:V-type ATP synthase subunit I [Caloramator fervidus]ABD18894.1 NtpI [Caloramator fervidus DSM 5463]SEF72355.1 V/A-type H+-transporting ATPase subunit I [Caloramator fervidus]